MHTLAHIVVVLTIIALCANTGVVHAQVMCAFTDGTLEQAASQIPLYKNMQNTTTMIFTQQTAVIITFNITITTPACGLTAIVYFPLESETQPAMQFTVATDTHIQLASLSGNIMVALHVMWCVQPYSAYFDEIGQSAFVAAAAYASTSTTLLRVSDGPCQADFRYDWPQLTNIKQVALGSRHGVALLTNGTLAFWGSNDYCQWGTGVATGDTSIYSSFYTFFTDFISVTAYGTITCAQRNNSDRICLGAFVPVPTGTACESYQWGRYGFTFNNISAIPTTLAISDTLIAMLDPVNNLIYVTGLLASSLWTQAVLASPTYENSTDYARSLSSSYGLGNTAWSYYVTLKIKCPAFQSAKIYTAYPGRFLLLNPENGALNGGIVGGYASYTPVTPNTPLYDQYSGVPIGYLFGNLTVLKYCNTGVATDAYIVCSCVGTCAVSSPSPVNWNGHIIVQYSATAVNSTDPNSRLIQTIFSNQSHSVQSNDPHTGGGYTLGTAHICYIADSWSGCFGSPAQGQIPGVPITGPTPSLWYNSNSYHQAVAGGYVTCYLHDTGIWTCVGEYGTGVVSTILRADSPILGPAGYSETRMFSTGYTGHNITLDRAGCFGNLTLLAGANSTSIIVTANQERYTISDDATGATSCVEVTSCASSDDVVRGAKPYPTCINSIAAGDHHTVILTCDGLVYAAGYADECQYIPLSTKGIDSRTFNQVWTGTMTTVGSIYANANITCMVSASNTSILCQGRFGPTTSVCTKSPLWIKSYAPRKIVSVNIGLTIVAIITTADNSAFQTSVFGNNQLWQGAAPANWNDVPASPVTSPHSVFAPPGTNIYENEGVQFLLLVMYPNPPGSNYSIPTCLLSSNVVSSFCTELTSGDPNSMAYYNFLDTGNIYVNQPSIPGIIASQLIGNFPGVMIIKAGGGAVVLNGAASFSGIPVSADTINPPAAVAFGYNISALAVGTNHAVVLTTDGYLCCAGNNAQGQCAREYTNISTYQFVCISPDVWGWTPSLAISGSSTPITEPPASEQQNAAPVAKKINEHRLASLGYLLLAVLAIVVTVILIRHGRASAHSSRLEFIFSKAWF